ncbi:hypothetical protein Q428_00650 [Fervidicella metallireducens AeB]|uniref:TATA-box binding protein n=1 Tax=Fervidicella metallireducens AeB TaxID=1403537 RepID=A0A017RYM5_9CLOT|nr:YwmB family TATA-box binding protein [Fervidicella metallireducens]EYE89883.1 hypothetical protein Q428_00650 [Fervidicella metallireducens AeB]
MKKWSKYIIITLIILIVTLSISKSTDGKETMMSCFKKSQAEFIRMDIEGSAEFFSDEDMETILKTMFKSSEIKGEYKIFTDDMTHLVLKNNNFEAHIKGRQLQDKKGVYVSFMLSHNSTIENINNIWRTISEAFAIYNVEPSFSTLIQGKYNKRFSISEMKGIGEKIFMQNSGNVIGKIDDGKVVSLYGYIPGLGNSIDVSRKKVNLNVALRYSEVNCCTYIWIGNPIITLEY